VALVIAGPELRTPPTVAPRAHQTCTPQLPHCRPVLALVPCSALPRTRCSTHALTPLRALPLAPATRLRASAGPAPAAPSPAPCVRTPTEPAAAHRAHPTRQRRCAQLTCRSRHRAAQLLLLRATAGLVGPGLAVPFQCPHTRSRAARAPLQPASLVRPRSCAPAPTPTYSCSSAFLRRATARAANCSPPPAPRPAPAPQRCAASRLHVPQSAPASALHGRAVLELAPLRLGCSCAPAHLHAPAPALAEPRELRPPPARPLAHCRAEPLASPCTRWPGPAPPGACLPRVRSRLAAPTCRALPGAAAVACCCGCPSQWRRGWIRERRG
jgi:hypothetical protein